MAGSDRFERTCGRGGDERTLRTRLLEELRSVVPFDAHAWVLTDPETCVGWSPLADGIPLGDLAALIRLKYLTTVNRWTTLSTRAAATLVGTTGGDRMQSLLWAELLARRGIDDVASTVFRDQHGCWGFLDLWRAAGPFDDRERELLGDLTTVATPALRRAVQLTFEPAAADLDPRSGPAVVLLTGDLEIVTGTKQVEADLRSLLPTDADRQPVPAAVLNAAAQLLAVEAGVDDHPPRARAHLDGSRWVTVAAARTEGSWSSAAEPGLIAVTVEPTTPTERAALFARVVGMTARETDLLHALVEGCDTREIAARLHVSEHTVQDHLKSMFAKTGARNRKTVVAWATGGGSSATT